MIQAKCYDCRDIHALGERKFSEDSLIPVCPACGSTSYKSIANGKKIKKSEGDRIADSLSHVGGVGDGILRRIQEKFSTLAELESASSEDLLEVEGVGEATAQNIIDVLRRKSTRESRRG